MRFIRCCIFLFLIVAPWITIDAQDFYDRDSLWRVFRISNPDTNRVKLFIQLGQQYEGNNPDSAIWLYEQAYNLSENLNYTRGILSYYSNVTYVYNLKGRYDTALLLNEKSVEIARAFGDPERLAACISNVGASYMNLDQYEKAIENYLQVVPVFEGLKSQSKLGVVFDNLCVLYSKIDQHKKSCEYGERAVRIARESGNPYSTATAQINLAVAYNTSGQMRKAITLLEEARTNARNSDNQYALMVATINICDAHIKMAEFATIKRYSEEALALANQLGEPETRTIALRGIAVYYFNFDQPIKAEGYALQSLKEAEKNNLLVHIGKAYSLLAEISILKKDFKKNSRYSFMSDSIRSVLVNETVTKNVQNLEALYESEKKARQINDLEQKALIKDLTIEQNQLLILVLAAVLISVLVITLLSRRSYTQKKLLLEKNNALKQSRISELEAEKQLLASEAVIKGQEEERGRLAKDLHDGLGGLLSGVKFSLTNMKSNVILDSESALVFERSLDMLDHSISELRRVAHNMMPEVLVKFGLNEAVKSYCDSIRQAGIFQIDFQTIGKDQRFTSGSEIILYRIIQELLNNSVKHSKASTVLMQLAWQAGEISITVEDNGVGFDVQDLEKSTGSGWPNIKSRVNYLNGKIDIQSTKGNGTSVHLLIKT